MTIKPGAGGTESQDWRPFFCACTCAGQSAGDERLCARRDSGEEAGIKSATIQFSGENAYGLLTARREFTPRSNLTV